MAQARRPYFRNSFAELLALFENHKHDAIVLEELRLELTHRDRPLAKALAKEVQETITAIHTTGAYKGASSFTPVTPVVEPAPKEVENDEDSEEIPDENSELAEDVLQTTETQSRKTAINSAGRTMIPIRACGPLRDVPETYIFPREETLKLNIAPGTELHLRYVVAIKAHIDELRRFGGSQVVIAVREGKRLAFEGGKSGYQFTFNNEADNIFDGANVLIAVGRRTYPGKVVAVILGEKIILVETDEDIGEEIPAAELRIDNTAMLEQLAERLEKIGHADAPSFNRSVAEAAMQNGGTKIEPVILLPPDKPLLENQSRAARMALEWSVSYIWGPPGTGKTHTLTAIVNSLFKAKKRTLIVSNTNQAVDHVLCKLCDLYEADDLVQKGGIVRIGRIIDQDLKDRHSDKVIPAEIAERLGAALKQRKGEIEAELRRSAAKLEPLKRVESAFKLIDDLQNRITEALSNTQKLVQEQGRLAAAVAAERKMFEETEIDIQAWHTAGALRRMVMKSLDALTARKGASQIKLDALRSQWTDIGIQIKIAETAISAVKTQAHEAESDVKGHHRVSVLREIVTLEEARRPLTTELAEINKKLTELEESIIRNAKVLGATVSKLFLSPQLFSGFSTVIIDEASMGLAPALFYAAGIAEERVLVCGDFRQLPPILSTKQKAIYDEIGRDIFHIAGISSKVRANQSVPTLVMLNEQHRMAADICAAISGPMYDGKLKTVAGGGGAPVAPEPFNHTITFVDTWSLIPFVGFDDGGSRYNIIHAIVARNIALYLKDKKFEDREIGIAVGYRAQSRLISRMLGESGADEITVGTVHRFQGSEKGVMILDIPEGEGDKVAGRFLQGESPDDEGPRLVNVAISRAKSHLVIISNRRFLDRKLPGNARVRDMLYRAQENATIIDAKDVLSMRPVDWSKMPHFGPKISIPENKALFNQHDFGPALAADLSTARKSVVIFSGFITLGRAATYGERFRQLLESGVKIRCITRSSMTNKADTPENTDSAIEALRGIGCVVDLRSGIHQKIVIIDERILWVGSLNPLSYTPNTDEMMVRVEGEDTARQIAEYQALPGYARDGKRIYEQENPSCEKCKTPMVWVQRKTGGFFVCPGENCGFTTDLRKMRARTAPSKGEDIPEEGPPCPICGDKTRRRNGKFGAFHGCIKYPNCRGIARAAKSGRSHAKPNTRSHSKN